MKKQVNTSKLKIRKGDTVKVIAGNDRNTDPAEVIAVFPKDNKALVKGRNMKTKHQKPNAQNPEGGISQVEAPIHISNLMLIDPKSGEATRVGRKADSNGKLQRYSKKTGEIISNG
jgi:large subunit ribosomal protein L24